MSSGLLPQYRSSSTELIQVVERERSTITHSRALYPSQRHFRIPQYQFITASINQKVVTRRQQTEPKFRFFRRCTDIPATRSILQTCKPKNKYRGYTYCWQHTQAAPRFAYKRTPVFENLSGPREDNTEKHGADAPRALISPSFMQLHGLYYFGVRRKRSMPAHIHSGAAWMY